MGITPTQIQTAEAQQHLAAHDPSPQVRAIAGPGTGKTHTIQERVRWLISGGVAPQTLFVVSFTRASSRDLRDRIVAYCQHSGQVDAAAVRVSTLHSLALRALRAAGLLAYPSDPLVMDQWELENVHDPEFSRASGTRPGTERPLYTPSRAKLIREDFEAFCGTGRWRPPGYILPSPPVSRSERRKYRIFHTPRTQLYSYVLPGEIVRQCVENISAGALDPGELLGIEHLIVDEYQDLNPTDISFIDHLISSGVTVFVAGDDDQSIYSFRYASPGGIQSFVNRHLSSGSHQLTDCFRCTPEVLSTGLSLMLAHSTPARIAKQTASLYLNSRPPEPGIVHRWVFQSGIAEARAIAESCRLLIATGMHPREIMILLSNTRALLNLIVQALEDSGVSYESPRGEAYLDTRSGRYAFSIIRIVCDRADYLAHRVLMGARPQIGPGTCNAIAEAAINRNLNFQALFRHPLPTGVFAGRQLTALRHARTVCSSISSWAPDDEIGQRSQDIHQLILSAFGQQEADDWDAEISYLPPDMTLSELRDYLWADNDEQRALLLQAVYERLELEVPEAGFLPPQVRIMTMHGAKGLSARVVFIPCLEEEMLPGSRRQPFPGLVLEAARLLYVSITRARSTCILSHARTRIVYGNFSRHHPSRFIRNLGGHFGSRTSGLTSIENGTIIQSCLNL
ncbi:MAG: ATP-dependent helicase [Anaerolineales bacterium]